MSHRVVIVHVNRYGLSFARNQSPRTYKESGLRFASYYRLACTRCGYSFAGPSWRRHRLEDCDKIIKLEPELRRLGLSDLKGEHLRGAL